MVDALSVAVFLPGAGALSSSGPLYSLRSRSGNC